VVWLFITLSVLSPGNIEWWEALVFVLLHVVYVTVCIYTDGIVSVLCPIQEVEDEPVLDKRTGEAKARRSLIFDSMGQQPGQPQPVRRSRGSAADGGRLLAAAEEGRGRGASDPSTIRGKRRSSEAWAQASLSVDSLREPLLKQPPQATLREDEEDEDFGEGEPGSTLEAADSDEDEATHLTPLMTDFDADVTMAQAKRPSFLIRTDTLQARMFEALMDGAVHKKNRFHQWERRWLIIDSERVHYIKSPLTYKPGGYSRLIATAEQADVFTAVPDVESPNEFHIRCGGSEFIFWVNSEQLRDRWVSKLMAWRVAVLSGHEEEKEETHGVTFAEWVRSLKYTMLAPVEVAVRATMPDLSSKPGLYVLTIFNCCLWMAGLSFFMTWAGEKMGKIVGLSSAVVGLTIGAAGTSLPNLFASAIVAAKGQGEMAVANAYGSNVFNINIALGLPWLCVTLVDRGKAWNITPAPEPGKPQVPSPMAFNAILLMAFIVAFIIVAALSKLRLHKPVGWLFLICYVVYLVYAIVAEYVPWLNPDITINV